MFPERLTSNKTTDQPQDVKKCKRLAHLLYMNKGRSGRRITTRIQENTEAVWQSLERNQRRISARRNESVILPSLFCQIIRTSLGTHIEMVIHHNLKDGDYDRCSCFCQWFLHQCNNQQFLATFLIGDKARIALNGTVNNHNVQMYAPAIQLTDFHIFFTISMIDNKNLLLG